jgi:hypothetical protein
MNMIIILFLLLLIALNIKKETFTNTPLLIYQAEYNTDSLDILITEMNRSNHILGFLKNRKNIKFATEENHNVIITDPLHLAEYKFISVFSDDKACLFIKGKDDINNESLHNIIENNKPIGYTEELDKHIITYIALGLGYRNLKINFVKIQKLPNIIDEPFFLENGIYTLFVFVCLQNKEFNSRFTLALDFINYENFDVNIIKMFMPYSKIKNLDLSIYFKNFENRYTVKTCLCFDMILAGKHKIEHDPDLNLELSNIIHDIGNMDLLNFYTIYFDMFKQTRDYISIKNRHIKIRDQLPILEQFSASPDITIPIHLEGYYTNNTLTLEDKNPSYDGIPFLPNANIKLTGQFREEENGDYKVSTRHSFILIHQNKVQPIPSPFECYNDDTIKTKSLCESEFDASGVVRKAKMEWDKRCVTNEECPYYQANKNYKNYFGGCIDGYCQMPLGVQLKSYRRPNDTTPPLCHNCANPLDPYCCEDQKDRKKYPNLKSPDYAFPLDSYDRKKTFIQP